MTVKDLCPAFNTKKPNRAVHSYCEETIFLAIYGDELQTNLYGYHRALLTQMEQRFRYTTEWMNDDYVADRGEDSETS